MCVFFLFLQMAALLWTVVFVLLQIQCSAAVSETELAEIVNQLLNVYRPTYLVHGNTPTFTLAVSVPFNRETSSYDVSQVTAADSSQNVRTALDTCQVYQGSRVVGAMVLKWPDVKNQCPNSVIPATWTFVRELCKNVQTWGDLSQVCTNNINKKLAKSPNGAVDHAEYRVLQNFNNFVNRFDTPQRNSDLLVFYSYKSPCDTRCASLTNQWSILPSINAIKKWSNHVLAFSEIFVPVRTSFTPQQLEANRRTALTNIGAAIDGLGNVYRCRAGRCSSCSGQSGVADTCVRDSSRSPSPIGK